MRIENRANFAFLQLLLQGPQNIYKGINAITALNPVKGAIKSIEFH
jgi:hypothetical protein